MSDDVTPSDDGEAEMLLEIAAGDMTAVPLLLSRYRQRLRQMVQFRLDPRVAARVDASDVVQEAMLTATCIIQEYARERPVAFYPWLRRITWKRMVDMQRQHLDAKRRSVRREVALPCPLSQTSLFELARRLVWNGPAPSHDLQRQEVRERIQRALEQLEPSQREVILLRNLEQLSLAETAAVLNITTDAVKMRQLRALRRLSQLMDA